MALAPVTGASLVPYPGNAQFWVEKNPKARESLLDISAIASREFAHYSSAKLGLAPDYMYIYIYQIVTFWQ